MRIDSCTTEYTEFHGVFNVIQSEAKDLEDTAQPTVDAPEILRRDAPLDDKGNRGAKNHKSKI